jgi:HD-like signal output (HDOD) protein
MGVLSPAAFLVEIGKVIIAQVIMSEKKEAEFTSVLEELGDADAAEMEVVGVNTAEVSAKIFEHWRFEENLVNVIANSKTPQDASSDDNKRAAAILDAVRTTILLNGTVSDESIEKAKAIIEEFNLDLESYENALENFK